MHWLWRKLIIASLCDSAIPQAASLKIWFGYVKEELVCFRPGDLERMFGYGDDVSTSDMVVLLELSRRPSARDLETDGKDVPFDIESCELAGGFALDAQMSAKLRPGMEFLQLRQYAEDNPSEPDQSLLSIWFDPAKVAPGAALAYKNRFRANSTACEGIRRPKTGHIDVFYDKAVSLCPEFGQVTNSKKQRDWPQYDKSKSVLAASWTPRAGGAPFAIVGANLPSRYEKGKNHMVARVLNDIEQRLNVSASQLFLLGDMNTRLSPDAWKACGSGAACANPSSQQMEAELATKCDEVDPEVEGGYGSTTECFKAFKAMKECRQRCLGDFACNASERHRLGSLWQHLDPKRDAAGYDLLAKYFTFAPDRHVRKGSNASEARLPTYKRRRSGSVAGCQAQMPFNGLCPASPCASSPWHMTCLADFGDCFSDASLLKVDVIPMSDPVPEGRGRRLVLPQLGWLDSFGYSKELVESIELQHYEDAQAFVGGDHAAFSASVLFQPGAGHRQLSESRSSHIAISLDDVHGRMQESAHAEDRDEFV